MNTKEYYREYARAWRAKNRQRYNEYHREYAKSHPAKTRRNRNRDLLNAWLRAYRKLPIPRLKKYARNTVRRAILAGTLKKKPCKICGSRRVQAHHPDYTRPLRVIWLCAPCHRQEHSR